MRTEPPSRNVTIAMWALAGLLALAFLAVGSFKLMGDQMHVDNFERWGYPIWFMYVVGVVEVLGALSLLYPRTAAWGALLLTGNMTGATITHLLASEWAMAPVPLVLGVLLVVLAKLRWPDRIGAPSPPTA